VLGRRLGPVRRSHRHQLGDDLAAAGDGDLAAALDLVEQGAELVLGVEDAEFLRGETI
jgi:hypothetical protein